MPHYVILGPRNFLLLITESYPRLLNVKLVKFYNTLILLSARVEQLAAMKRPSEDDEVERKKQKRKEDKKAASEEGEMEIEQEATGSGAKGSGQGQGSGHGQGQAADGNDATWMKAWGQVWDPDGHLQNRRSHTATIGKIDTTNCRVCRLMFGHLDWQ